jgi:hypothetical protein
MPDYPAFKYITTVEKTVNGKTPTWLHFDVRNIKLDGKINFIDV